MPRWKFFSYLSTHGLTLPKQVLAMDGLLSDYLEFLWMEGEGRSLASDTIAALQDQEPHLKNKLAHSWRLIKTWLAHEIPNRAPPFTEQVLHTLAGYSIFHGRHEFALPFAHRRTFEYPQ